MDEEGRSALHLAVSCGRRDLCHWLIKAGKGDINLKDSESGYTPLHRSIFYGHINIAVTLIEVSTFKSYDRGIVLESVGQTNGSYNFLIICLSVRPPPALYNLCPINLKFGNV